MAAVLFACLLARFGMAGEAPPVTPEDPLDEARRAYRDGEFAHAEELYLRLCEAAPQNGDIWFELARVQYRLKNFEASFRSFESAEKNHAGNKHFFYWLGFAAFKLDRWAEVERALAQVTPEDATEEVRLKLAIARFNLNRASAPAELARLAALNSPAGTVARYYQALTHENSGEPGAAFDLYQALMLEDKPFPAAALERLRALQPPAWTCRFELSGGYDSRPTRTNDDTNRSGSSPDGFTQGSFRFAGRPFYTVGSISPVVYWLSVFGYERLYHREHKLDYAIVGVMQSLENSPERAFNYRLDNAFRRHWLHAKPYFDEAELSGAVQWRHRRGGLVQAWSVGADGSWTQAAGADYQAQEGLTGSLTAGYAIGVDGEGWSLTCPWALVGQMRSADLQSEGYVQYALQFAPSIVIARRVLLAVAFELDARRYRPDPLKANHVRREWPAFLTASLETPLWTHASIQANFQITEQGANQAAYRFTNRQIWLSAYLWF